MDKCREAFEKKFPIPAHWIEFDEKRNKYYCPYVAEAKASEYQARWEVWQSRQAELNQAYEDIETFAQAHQRECEFKAQFAKEVDFLKAQLGIKRDQIKGFESEIKKTWQAVEEKDKRIEGALNHLNDVRNKGMDQSCYLAIKALRGNNANS
ncbi:hypothetical protein ACG9ZL_16440 [Acinetobacter sp. ULE_I057]|uniref:hypothetical protein n=1 Tax=Acinetobacter sp. ULE_I057 TaxID=3373070 RepID=UPI003AF84758